MDWFFKLKNKGAHLSADDVPPTDPWATNVTPKAPKRQFYYEMYESTTLRDNMATPFVDKSESKAPAELTSVQNAKDKEKKAMPHCKACTDFKTWMELTANPRRLMPKVEREEKQCPLDSDLLGSNTWSFLHTMAAYYPERPTYEQQHNMKSFITLLSQFYPCHICASHLREDLKTNFPDTSNNVNLSHWFCDLHNKVNERLGKPLFDCSKVLERWRDGWADNSCD